MNVRVLRAGDRALMLAPDDPERVVDIVAALSGNPIPDIEDVLPAAETVLIAIRAGADQRAVYDRLLRLAATAVREGTQGRHTSGTTLVIPVDYTGPDLAEVARCLELSPAALVELHTRSVWRCTFVGFAPGFGYLASPDWNLRIPRLATPRTEVQPGSVAVAAEYTTVYPSRTPGGWRVIGSTDISMFDVNREPPALVAAGHTVRFVAR